MEIVNGLQYFFKYYLNTEYLKTCHGKHVFDQKVI